MKILIYTVKQNKKIYKLENKTFNILGDHPKNAPNLGPMIYETQNMYQ